MVTSAQASGAANTSKALQKRANGLSGSRSKKGNAKSSAPIKMLATNTVPAVAPAVKKLPTYNKKLLKNTSCAAASKAKNTAKLYATAAAILLTYGGGNVGCGLRIGGAPQHHALDGV